MIQKLIWMVHAAFAISLLPMALTKEVSWTFVHVALALTLIVLLFVRALNKPTKLERIHARSR